MNCKEKLKRLSIQRESLFSHEKTIYFSKIRTPDFQQKFRN